jgi:uncharacterized membrane protein YadS
MVIATLIFICAVAIGFLEGRSNSRALIVVATGVAILGASNLAANWPWFTSDPSTWARTYGYGLLQTGVVSLAIHLLPFIAAYLLGGKSRGHSRLVEE